MNGEGEEKPPTSGKKTYFSPLVQSPSDNRKYRILLFENGLKVLLVTDNDCDKAAVSLSVAVGSMSDPVTLQGLAHLCEHMLLHENCSEEKSYVKLISENGGMSNAFTTRDETNFHFDIVPTALNEALERFSKFFARPFPLFPGPEVAREVGVIQSEFENKLNNDFWRKGAVEATRTSGTSYSSTHPFFQFSIGNRNALETIPGRTGENVSLALVNFHKIHYSSNIMSLVVLGNQSLDELETLVRESQFPQIPNGGLQMPSWDRSPFGPEELGKRVDIVPIGDIRDLYISFPIPDTSLYYKSGPHVYLRHLIGHRGPGSIHSLLAKKNWINNTYVTTCIPARGFAIFSIGFQCTVEGLNNIEEIIAYTFQYIQMLRVLGPQGFFWKELRDILKIQFQFLDKEPTLEMTHRTASLMHIYPLEDILSAGYFLTEFSPSSITEFMDHLTAAKCRITTIHKGNEIGADLVEKWFSVKYSEKELPQHLIQAWDKSGIIHDELKLPIPNVFIPSDFDLKARDPDVGLLPRLIQNTIFSRVWFLQDKEYGLPKGVIKLQILSSLPTESPLNCNHNAILGLVMQDNLREELYSANLTGIHHRVQGTVTGLEISVDGFHENLWLVLEKILEELREVESQRFRTILETYSRGLRNWGNQPPHLLATYYATLLLREKKFSNEELLDVLGNVTLETLQKYSLHFLQDSNFEWFIFGNMTEDECLTFVQKCHGSFQNVGLGPLQSFRLRDVCLAPGSNWVLKCKSIHPSSCVCITFQLGVQNTRDNILAELIEQILHEPCFRRLRTKENLGYIVRTSLRRSNGTLAFQITVQSDQDPEFVESRIENFLKDFKVLLEKMNSGEFNQHKIGLGARRKEKPKLMTKRGDDIWNNEIRTRQYNFDRLRVELLELETITLEQVLEYFQVHIANTKRRRLRIHIVGSGNQKKQKMVGKNIIQDIGKWKTGANFYSFFEN